MFKRILTKKKTICILSGILLILIVWTAWGEHCIGTEHIRNKQPWAAGCI